MRSLALAAAAALLAAPMTTHAQGAPVDAWSAFHQICWDTDGDYLAGVKAAAADGWTDTDIVASDDDPSVSLTDKAAKSKTVGQTQLSMLLTRGLRKMSNGAVFKVTTCKIASNGPAAGLIQKAQAWVGGPPDKVDPPDAPTLALFFVKPAPGKPDHIGLAGAQAAMDAGAIGYLKFQEEKDGPILIYTVLTK